MCVCLCVCVCVFVCVCVCVCDVCVCEEGRRMNHRYSSLISMDEQSITHTCKSSILYSNRLKEVGRPTFNYSCSIHLKREGVFHIDYG